jgi:hypothetical protein
MSPQESRPRATNAEPAKDVSAGGIKSGPIVPQKAQPHVATRLQWRRKITRELDEFFGIFHYPDVASLYAMPPTREPE